MKILNFIMNMVRKLPERVLVILDLIIAPPINAVMTFFACFLDCFGRVLRVWFPMKEGLDFIDENAIPDFDINKYSDHVEEQKQLESKGISKKKSPVKKRKKK